MARHRLKTWPESFEAITSGVKKYEIRSTKDRDFAVGDVLALAEWDPKTGDYTGREAVTQVVHLTEPGYWGLPESLCVMGIDFMQPWVRK